MARYTIIGAGAIGAILGVHFIGAGHEVDFIEANAEHVAAIRKGGLRLTGALEATVHPPACLPTEAAGPLGAVLLAVKARHTEAALAPLVPQLGADGFVVSLQNGLEEYKIARLIGEARTVGAFLTFGGHYKEPGEVVFGGRGSFGVGEMDGRDTPRIRRLATDFAALQPVTVTDNIFGYLWSKMALGAVYFATATVSMDVVKQYDNPRWRAAFGALVGEVVAVAAAHGVRCEAFDGFDPSAFRPDAPDAQAIAQSWEGQRRYWGRHEGGRTGVWRDLAQHRRPTEVNEQVGAVIARAEMARVAVPLLARLHAMVRECEQGRRGLDPANLDELAGAAGV